MNNDNAKVCDLNFVVDRVNAAINCLTANSDFSYESASVILKAIVDDVIAKNIKILNDYKNGFFEGGI